MLSLILARLPNTLTGPAGDGYNGHVPIRALFANPDAVASLFGLENGGGLVYTDIFRDAAGQLRAKTAKPASTKAVSLSPHGYGLAVDLDVDATCKRRGFSYARLLEVMAASGWHCHRRDGARGSEDWHFNFLGGSAPILLQRATAQHSTWDDPVEGRIQQLYGAQLAPGDAEIPALLKRTGSPSIRAFQTAWALTPDGIVGPVTRRTLAYVASELDLRQLVG